MRRIMEIGLVGLALAGGALAAVTPAAARDDVHISIDAGSVAFGYRDGYWDRDRQWHEWRNHDDADWYRTHNKEHYYDRKHEEEREHGWRNDDRWWDRR